MGELAHVSLASTIWFNWCGWLLLLVPILLWPKRNRNTPLFLIALLMSSVCPHNLAGALELFLCDGFRDAGSANLVRSAQTS